MRASYAAALRHAIPALLLVTSLTLRAETQSAPVPPGVAGLLPPEAVLDSSDWGVFESEFGKTFTGGMRAEFPGRPASCDVTVGPELRVILKGDTAWEAPPMLDLAVQAYTDEIAAVRAALPGHVATLTQTNGDLVSVGTLQEQQLPNAELLYIEYTENCARHPDGTNTVLRGFARKGATIFKIDLWISAGAGEATAMAKDMIQRFEAFDVGVAIN